MLNHAFVSSVLLLLMLLNPFLLIIYLIDLIEDLDTREFRRVLIRAGMISGCVFAVFALLGDFIFDDLLQARFASFQIFGGIIFLLIGIQFVFTGPEALRKIRGAPEHIAGSIAMPIMIGPATVSASILIGSRVSAGLAVIGIFGAVALTVATILVLKRLHDFVRPRNGKLIERYIEVMGRITALVVGTFSIEMIMQGVGSWLAYLGSVAK